MFENLQDKLQDVFKQLGRRGKLSEAAELYKDFLKTHPQHPDALHLRGVALFQLNDAASAEPLLRKAVSIKADEPDYHSNLGLILQKLERHQEALESFKVAVALQPFAVALAFHRVGSN